ncbi:Aconitate B N-terminal domain-containing protein [Pseudomonas sp. NFACC15-1]|uniref:hypothetical protein n=1 Tax=unclassified Pseudomonas TaxID=196821 RepID=UPI000889D94D|nr:Aconitate B N-terminal domain-containing protein [Pseudomonas sp. NFACC15-1]SDW84261.1 Aconitate B N-terminal domain-containing protein [Pseudomonas sp. NFACC14]
MLNQYLKHVQERAADHLPHCPLNAEQTAAAELKHTLLVFDAFHDVVKARAGNAAAHSVLHSWADAQWFTRCAPIARQYTLAVLKVCNHLSFDQMANYHASTAPSQIDAIGLVTEGALHRE